MEQYNDIYNRNKKLDDIGEQISNLAKSSNHQAEERTKKEYSLYL